MQVTIESAESIVVLASCPADRGAGACSSDRRLGMVRLH